MLPTKINTTTSAWSLSGGWPACKIQGRLWVPRPRFWRAGIFLFETLPFQSRRSNDTTIAIDIYVIMVYVVFGPSPSRPRPIPYNPPIAASLISSSPIAAQLSPNFL